MIRIPKYSKNHWITILVFLSFVLSIVGSEWTQNGISYSFFVISQILPSFCLFCLILITGAFRFEKRNKSSTSWYNVGVIAVLFILLFQGLGFMGYNSIPRSEIGIIQAIFAGYMGYWIAGDERELSWLLNKFAGLSVVMGILDVVGTYSGLGENNLMFPSWQTRLIVLFGYCWYLYRWLTGPKKISLTALWLAGCSGGIWLTFHKPIIFAAFFSTIFIFVLVIRTTHKKTAMFKRIIILLVFVYVAFLSANYYSSGAIVDAMKLQVYHKFLRVDEGTSLNQLQKSDLGGASGGRLDMWPKALEQIRNHPFFGVGKKIGWDYGATHVHNWYLDMLLWVGIFGFFPFFAGLIWWFRLSIKKIVLSCLPGIIIPSIGYIIGLMAYNFGGTMRVFFSITSFAVIIMAVSTRPAQDMLRSFHASRQLSGILHKRDFKSEL
jgi:hypothetical protein